MGGEAGSVSAGLFLWAAEAQSWGPSETLCASDRPHRVGREVGKLSLFVEGCLWAVNSLALWLPPHVGWHLLGPENTCRLRLRGPLACLLAGAPGWPSVFIEYPLRASSSRPWEHIDGQEKSISSGSESHVEETHRREQKLFLMGTMPSLRESFGNKWGHF